MNTQEQVDVTLKEALIDQKSLILFNDDVNTFEHVIDCLVSICKHSHTQAEQCAYIVHYKGKCIVKGGSFEELNPMHEALSLQQLSVEIK